MTTARLEENEDMHDDCSDVDVKEEEEKETRHCTELERYIPHYLKQFIYPYHDEFCYTRIFHHRLVAALMVEGFLPIAIDEVILPKLHHQRCVISLPESLHISKSTRKKSKKYRMTVNKRFTEVVDGCRRQHGSNCWLYPELVRVFKEIHDNGQVDLCVYCNDGTIQKEAPVRLYSIEIYNEESGDLVAGELGYTVGCIYTSLTGFSAENSAGSVQLACLGRMLCTLQFSMWDLGMDMEYKQSLGAHLMPRNDFIAHVHSVRSAKSHIIIPTKSNISCDRYNTIGYNCKSVIDQDLPLVSMSTNDEGKTKVNFLPAPQLAETTNPNDKSKNKVKSKEDRKGRITSTSTKANNYKRQKPK